MSKPAVVQQVSVRRVSSLRKLRADIFTIGPRKALMEQLEARSTLNRNPTTRPPRAAKAR